VIMQTTQNSYLKNAAKLNEKLARFNGLY
jgi:hypothetical protein